MSHTRIRDKLRLNRLFIQRNVTAIMKPIIIIKVLIGYLPGSVVKAVRL